MSTHQTSFGNQKQLCAYVLWKAILKNVVKFPGLCDGALFNKVEAYIRNMAGGFQVVLRNFSKQFLHRATRSGYVLVTRSEAGTLVPTSRLSSVQLGPLRTSLKQLVQQF